MTATGVKSPAKTKAGRPPKRTKEEEEAAAAE